MQDNHTWLGDVTIAFERTDSAGMASGIAKSIKGRAFTSHVLPRVFDAMEQVGAVPKLLKKAANEVLTVAHLTRTSTHQPPPPSSANTRNPFRGMPKLKSFFNHAGPTSSEFGSRDDSLGFAPAPSSPPPVSLSDEAVLDALIALQTFEGYWDWSAQLISLIDMPLSRWNELLSKVRSTGNGAENDEQKRFVATAAVVAFLEGRLRAKREVWELVVEKARRWLGDAGDKAVELAGFFVEGKESR
jgi:hypothetical protein